MNTVSLIKGDFRVVNNLNIGTRLGVAFAIVVALLIVSAYFGINTMGRIQDRLIDIAEVNNQESSLASAILNTSREIAIGVRDVILLTDDDEMTLSIDQIKKYMAERTVAEEKLKSMFYSMPGTTAKAKMLYASILELQKSADPLVEKTIALGLKNQREATKVFMTEALPSLRALINACQELSKFEEQLNAQATNDAKAAYESGRTFTIALAVIAALIAASGAWLVTSSITRPIGEAVGIAAAIAKGDLTVSICSKGADETAYLLQALDGMRTGLVNLVSTVRQSSENVATASAEIAHGNQDLSARTESQSSALEETAASMEELSSQVKHNADGAHHANQLASSASAVAIKGGEVVGRVVDTMKEINNSSQKISEIISVIDGIAFQTNILALNAAVEAARAGEQGRGFAVVASEVRSLAGRSADAAKEIKSLIHASVEKVEYGTTLVDEAGTTMAEVVGAIRRVSDLVGEISAASNEQAAGVAHVGEAVSQMDQATQQNAALVEQMAAAASSLKSQASDLVETVSVFKINSSDTVAKTIVKSPAKKPAALKVDELRTLPTVGTMPKPIPDRTSPVPKNRLQGGAIAANQYNGWEVY